MTTSLALKVKIREHKGKGPSRRMRAAGGLPAILYGRQENLPLTVDPKQLHHIIGQKGRNAIIDLSVEGDSKKRKVLLKETQTHPLKPGWVHVDFQELDMTQKIRVHVPVKLTGTAPGIKQGGIINQIVREMHIECLPDNIPEIVEVAMDNVQLNEMIHISDVHLSDDIEVLHNPKDPIVTLYEEKVIEEVKPAEEAEGAEAPVAGEATPAAEESAKTES